MERNALWLIGVPTEGSDAQTRSRIVKHAVDRNLCTISNFQIPALRVGTLDKLMSLCDSLSGSDMEAEALVKRIAKTYADLQVDMNSGSGASSGVNSAEHDLLVDNVLPTQYIRSFQWDTARYPTNLDLKCLAEQIDENLNRFNESLKKHSSKYNETKTTLSTLNRKRQGSLLLKSLAGLIDPDDVVDGDYLTSLMVVVPVSKTTEFIETYMDIQNTITVEELMGLKSSHRGHDVSQDSHEMSSLRIRCAKLREAGLVVPGSAKQLICEADFVLFRVVVMTDAADAYRNACRAHRFTVRHFKYDPNEVLYQKNAESALSDDLGKRMRTLIQWCGAAYTEVFTSWIHLKAIRLFVESVLRFGLPVDFQSYILKVTPGRESQLRRTLGEIYSSLNTGTGSGPGSDGPDLCGLEEFYPYVYLSFDPWG